MAEELGAFPRDGCVGGSEETLSCKQTGGGTNCTGRVQLPGMCLSAFTCVAQWKLLPHFGCGLF